MMLTAVIRVFLDLSKWANISKDCEAYFIGFWIALIGIMLVNRYPEISPWFALLNNAYPVMETCFTIYRRKIYQNKIQVIQMGCIFIAYFIVECSILT